MARYSDRNTYAIFWGQVSPRRTECAHTAPGNQRGRTYGDLHLELSDLIGIFETLSKIQSTDVGELRESTDEGQCIVDPPTRVVYTPGSPLRHPGKLFREIVTDVWKLRELIWILFVRDLKAMYRQSYLGYAWIFAPPLATTAIWIFLNSQRIVLVSETAIPYPAFVLIGTTLWSTFASAVVQPLQSFQVGKPVFTKLKVPSEAFLAAGMARVLFDLVIRLVLLIPVFLLMGVFPPLSAILFPVALLCLLLLGLAFGVLLVPLGALYQDVTKGITMALQFLMYLTPVVYPPATSGWAATMFNWNPVTPSIMVARDWLTLGRSEHVVAMLVVAAISVVVLAISSLAARVAMPHLVQRMGM